MPVADELHAGATQVEPVGDHAIGDPENVDAVAVREVGADHGVRPARQDDFQNRIRAHGVLLAVVRDAQFDRLKQRRRGRAEKSRVVDGDRRRDRVTRSAAVQHDVDDRGVRRLRADREHQA